jgi:pSer/pThr/pTyr-binding forkhead associated (FHA) protein
MSRPPPSTITVCSGAVRRTFPPGRDVIVGSDIRADLRIPHPAISRAHTILRCVDGQWTAIDNDSPNGMFEGTERVRSVALLDIGMPAALALLYALFVRWTLRRKATG